MCYKIFRYTFQFNSSRGNKFMNAKSIGIIGGADGPTSIYIATSINWPLTIVTGLFIVATVIALILWLKKKRGQQ
ncbi:MAG: sodium ion-translocating decarboxylase subunit beta [Cellulosilyticaceae bacterium]